MKNLYMDSINVYVMHSLPDFEKIEYIKKNNYKCNYQTMNILLEGEEDYGFFCILDNENEIKYADNYDFIQTPCNNYINKYSNKIYQKPIHIKPIYKNINNNSNINSKINIKQYISKKYNTTKAKLISFISHVFSRLYNKFKKK